MMRINDGDDRVRRKKRWVWLQLLNTGSEVPFSVVLVRRRDACENDQVARVTSPRTSTAPDGHCTGDAAVNIYTIRRTRRSYRATVYDTRVYVGAELGGGRREFFPGRNILDGVISVIINK
jgi:hypothetical protein